MHLRQVAGGDCKGADECPTVFTTERGTVVIQGYVVPESEGKPVPAGEALVEIPVDLLKDAAHVIE